MSGLTDFHVFWGVAMTVAEAQSASVEEEFVTGLFGEYLAQGAPKNGRKWLSARLEDAFVCLHERPVWIGEPAWAYHQGQPMVFLHQVHVPPSAQHIKGKWRLAIRSTCSDHTIGCKGGQSRSGRTSIGRWCRPSKETPHTQSLNRMLQRRRPARCRMWLAPAACPAAARRVRCARRRVLAARVDGAFGIEPRYPDACLAEAGIAPAHRRRAR